MTTKDDAKAVVEDEVNDGMLEAWKRGDRNYSSEGSQSLTRRRRWLPTMANGLIAHRLIQVCWKTTNWDWPSAVGRTPSGGDHDVAFQDLPRLLGTCGA